MKVFKIVRIDSDIENYIGKTNTRPGLGRVENKDKDENI